jgi:hypothetical protein
MIRRGKRKSGVREGKGIKRAKEGKGPHVHT